MNALRYSRAMALYLAGLPYRGELELALGWRG